jgi:hypothetical protein
METESTENPNEKLVPIYEGDEMIWIPVTEWYVRNMGRSAINLGQIE